MPHLFRYKANGMIYVIKKFQRQGIPMLYHSTGERAVGAACTARDIMIQRHRNRALGIPDEHVFGRDVARPLSRVIDEVLEKHTPTLRLKTQVKHRMILGALRDEFGDLDIGQVTPPLVTDWIRLRRRVGRRKTFRDYTKYLNLVMNYARKTMRDDSGRPYLADAVEFKNPDPKRQSAGRLFTAKEIAKLWDAMGEETRDKFILAYPNGMRLREALGLTWDRVDVRMGKVTLRDCDVKTGRAREFILSAQARDRLKARHARRGNSPFVFPCRHDPKRPTQDMRTQWERVKAKAGITGRARWHDLRHTSISHALLKRGVLPAHASKFFGVSLAVIERVYLHSKADDTKGVASGVSIGGEE